MVDHSEPFTQLLTQGMVLKDGKVMSKSKGNVVDPDQMIEKYGSDALRLYVMFVAPPENEVEWSDAGLEGSFRFLARVWRLVDHWAEAIQDAGAVPAELNDAERAVRRKTHDTIRRVTVDIEERQHLNTPVSALMELVNDLYAFSETTPPAGRPASTPPSPSQLQSAGDSGRCPRGGRGAGADGVAFCAAYGRGALGAARTSRRSRRRAGRRLMQMRPRPPRSWCRCRSRQAPGAHHGGARCRRGRGARQSAGRYGRAGHIAGKTVRKVIVVQDKLVSVVVS